MKKLLLEIKGIVKAHPDSIKKLAANKASAGKIAPGFKPRPKLDLKFIGGRTIPDLSFKNFYLGAAAWSASDIQNIDSALSSTMSDPHLNNVMQQYFPKNKPITTKFLGSTKVSGSVKKTFTRDDVNPTVQALLGNGSL